MIWHLTFASQGRLPLFPTEAEGRAAVRALVDKAGPWLGLFCIVDDHVHVVVVCDEDRAGRVSRSILLALRALSRAPLQPAHRQPVQTRSHAKWLTEHYIIAQPVHHALPVHPALYAGSCFQDLVGARRIPGLRLRVSQVLPRMRLRSLFPSVGLPSAAVLPLPDLQVRGAGAVAIAQAAASALAVPPELLGRSVPVVTARRAAAQLCQQTHIPRSEIAFALKVSESSVRALLAKPVEPKLLTAVRVRLRLCTIAVLAPAVVAEEAGATYAV